MDDVKDSPAEGPRRRYHSPLRQENARQTRQAVIAAARELFTAHGYAATSLNDIATAANVARPTAFAAFGSKPALLHQVLDQTLAGDDEPVPVAQRPWFRPVWDAATPADVLDAYADVCALINARAARIVEVVRRAADQTAEIAELWDTVQNNRRAGARMVVEHAAATGPLAPGLDIERATDILWIFNDPAHYDALVIHQRWSKKDYQAWLSGQARHALLGH
ncbi:TetR/AcrR family transcriptional regulator [Amycolatopsis sp. FDAARGOS 1241]|uniref:TetR/AcrR family transcriptional regulator n=1 Tax=Amycolatopsis sp. FDAARGOS 1241 TaxID=2778070 RepID=UPI0019504299|nr:helix-turn-helix domain-containing protein [Amycolatopsis sp. FDAARGOS 1241]QRP42783.1 helix-turn-helix transcriptional regulator [Amycolatopsis sp. FDAARGOS 1241]